jgi:hypothetical protein
LRLGGSVLLGASHFCFFCLGSGRLKIDKIISDSPYPDEVEQRKKARTVSLARRSRNQIVLVLVVMVVLEGSRINGTGFAASASSTAGLFVVSPTIQD